MSQSGDLRVDQIMPTKLCKSWIKIDFEECLIEKGSYTKIKKSDIQETGNIPVIDQGENFISGYINDQNSIYKGDLPVIIFGDHTRRFKFINFKFAVGADGTKILCPFDALNPKFFYYYLTSLNIESQGYSRHYRFLKQIQVPIAPLNEQKRIVAKLEKLLTKVNESCDRLSRIPTILKRFRQSVLASACSGRLTADWRKSHPDIEPAEELLSQFKASKEYKKSTIKDELPIPFELPNTWQWINLIEGCESITDGDHQPPPKQDQGVPFLVISNIREGFLDFSDTRFVPKEYYDKIKDTRKPVKGDILYSVVGSYGIPVIVNIDIPFCFQRHIALLRVNFLLINTYLLYILKSRMVFDQATAVATGSAQLTVTLTGLKKIKIPLPPLEEQKEIVRRVEALFRKCDLIEQRYLKAKAYTDKLTQSILAKAFRGELVPQDPNDEPAEVLLERIREEKTLTQKSSKSKKTRKRKTT